MKDFKLNKNIDTPLYIQLYEYIKTEIEENQLQMDKLPSIRKLSKSLGVNNVTIISAYKLLESQGYVYSIEGSGTYLKKVQNILNQNLDEEDMELMISGILPISKDSINFASISPTSDLFPIEEFKQALVQVLDINGGEAFLYPEIIGFSDLRESISKFLFMNYNTQVSKDKILITSGSQQGLDIISKTLVNPGDTIIVENPTYPGAISAFKSRGAKLIGVDMLEDGMDIFKLKLLVKKYNPKFLYIMTNYQSPTTYSYSEKKKRQLLNMAEEFGFYIIEDDVLTDLSFEKKMKPILKSIDKDEKVIFIKSFSKIFMPGVRIGFITLPSHLFKDIIKAKHTTDVSTSGFLQRAFDLYLRKGYWKKHIEMVKTVYKNKYELMLENLIRFEKYGLEVSKPEGGLSLWIKLPHNIDAVSIYKRSRKKKLSVVPGKIFFIDDKVYSNYIRLSFGAVSEEDILRGLDILEEVILEELKTNQNKYLPFI